RSRHLSHRQHASDPLDLRASLIQLRLGLLDRGDVDHGADAFEIPLHVPRTAPQQAAVLYRTVRHQQAVFEFVIPFFQVPQILPEARAILRVGSLQYGVQRWHPIWVEFVNSERFVRPEYLSSREIPAVHADAADFLCFGQERFAPPQGVLGPLAVGDVDDHPGKETGRAIGRRNQRGIKVDPYGYAVLAHVALLDPITAAWAGYNRIEKALGFCVILLVRKITHRHAFQLVFGIPDHSLQRRVRRHETQVALDDRDADGRCLEHGSPAFLARTQIGLGLLAFGDILARDQH